MTPLDRVMLQSRARQLREIADEVCRLAPLQALKIQGIAQALELRLEGLERAAKLNEVRA